MIKAIIFDGGLKIKILRLPLGLNLLQLDLQK